MMLLYPDLHFYHVTAFKIGKTYVYIYNFVLKRGRVLPEIMCTVVGLVNSDSCVIATKLAVLLVYDVKVSRATH